MNRWFVIIGILVALPIWTVTSRAQATGMSSFYGNSTYPEHVFLPDNNLSHIHEFFTDSNNGWHDNDLTALANGAPTSGSLTSFYEGGSYPEHVFYLDYPNENVHELWSDSNGGWHDNNLTSLSHGAAAAINTALTAYYSGGSNPEHVFFIDTAAHLHAMYSDSAGNWYDQDLTTTVSVEPKPYFDSALTSFYVPGSSSPGHVFFIDNNQHLNELYSDSNNNNEWNLRDLTALTNGAAPNFFDPLSSFYRDTTYPEHVFFASQRHVHELWSDSSGGWHDSDITAQANGAAATGETGLFSFYAGGSYPEHAFFLDDSSDVHELWSDSSGSWHDSDLTILANAPTAGISNFLTGFYTGGSNPEHAFFVDDSPGEGRVNELKLGTTWNNSVIPW